MNIPSYSFPAFIAAAFVSLTVAAHAATLASDNFTLSSGTNTGTVSNTSSSGIGTYTTIQGTTGMSVVNGATLPTQPFGSGNVLSLGNNTNTYYRAFNGASTLTLGSLTEDQTLSLSFDIRVAGTVSTSAQNFSFGFVNTASTVNSVLYANVNLNGGTSEFRYRASSFNMSDAGTQLPGTAFWTDAKVISTNSYNFQLDVTKQSNGSYLIEYYRNDSLLGSTTEAGNSVWATAMAGVDITGVAFRHSQLPGLTTYLDNVSVSVSTIPEPSTYAFLGGVGALGLALTQRRKRN